MNFANAASLRRRGRLWRGDAQLPPRLSGVERIQALTLPVRLALLEHVRRHGASTATEVGAALGITPAAASYHLRVLAQHGYLSEAGGEMDGRKRRWEATTPRLTVDPTAAVSREEAVALDRLEASLFERASDIFAGYIERRAEFPHTWRQAASSVQDTLVLTPAELSRLRTDLLRLLSRYRGRRATPAGDATSVFLAFNAVPLDPPPGPSR